MTDLQPALSSGHLSLSTDEPLGKAVVLPLWEGLGVHQLVLHLQPARRAGPAPRGVIFGLVRAVEEEVGGEVRMWSLATLTHLAQWRCHNLVSSCQRWLVRQLSFLTDARIVFNCRMHSHLILHHLRWRVRVARFHATTSARQPGPSSKALSPRARPKRSAAGSRQQQGRKAAPRAKAVHLIRHPH